MGFAVCSSPSMVPSQCTPSERQHMCLIRSIRPATNVSLSVDGGFETWEMQFRGRRASAPCSISIVSFVGGHQSLKCRRCRPLGSDMLAFVVSWLYPRRLVSLLSEIWGV